jgi:hypothetical protein
MTARDPEEVRKKHILVLQLNTQGFKMEEIGQMVGLTKSGVGYIFTKWGVRSTVPAGRPRTLSPGEPTSFAKRIRSLRLQGKSYSEIAGKLGRSKHSIWRTDKYYYGGDPIAPPAKKLKASSLTGIYWSKQKSRWHAVILVQKKKIHVGFFSTLEAAVAARQERFTALCLSQS